jgi:hypothetical protein
MTKWILVLAMCACQSAPRSTANVNSPQVAELTARRGQMIDWLQEYYERGVYPTDAAGKPISVFKDAQGVRCPMAELIDRSGHGELVDAVALQNNKLRLADVKAGPLFDWMAQSGLTIEEIAMVQGAMDIDYSWMPVQETTQTILAQGQVRGRLETAVTALNGGTNHSVQVAAKRLGKRPITVKLAAQPRAIRTVAEAANAPIMQR